MRTRWRFVQYGPEDAQVGDGASEVLAWLLERTQAGIVSAQVADTDDELRIALTNEGFVPHGTEFWLDMRRSLEDLPSPPLPDGFTLRTITPDERYLRAQLHRDVWAPSKVTDAAYDAVVATGSVVPRVARKDVLLQISHNIEAQAVADPWDVLAYAAGALIFQLWMNKRVR